MIFRKEKDVAKKRISTHRKPSERKSLLQKAGNREHAPEHKGRMEKQKALKDFRVTMFGTCLGALYENTA